MSKITAIRFVNLNYNDNKTHISDELFRLNRQNTMVNMANGGGKSVMVQMLIALFVHKRYRSMPKRAFEDYFTSAQPSFIMAEWELDGSDTKVTAGMMVRRNQVRDSDDDEQLEIINFISEYTGPCENDIASMPLARKSSKSIRIKSYADARALFESYKTDSRKKFWYYDMNGSAASMYFDKLSEYRIYASEWESIVKKINLEESGLSKLFSDSTDEKGLIEKWFLPSVEDKIAGRTRHGSQTPIRNYRKIVLDYAASYKANQGAIRRRDTLGFLMTDLETAGEMAGSYKNETDAQRKAASTIAAFSGVLDNLCSEAEEKAAGVKEELGQLKMQQNRVTYEKLSAAVHIHEAERDRHIADRNLYAAEKNALEKEAQTYLKRLHLLELSADQERVDELSEDFLIAKERLERLKVSEEELEPERESLGSALRIFYSDEKEKNEKKLTEITAEEGELGNRLTGSRKSLEDAENGFRRASEEKARVQARLDLFDKEEDRFNRDTGLSVTRNIMRTYEPGLLEGIEQDFETRKRDSEEEQKKLIRQRDDLQNQIRGIDQDIDRIREDISGASADLRIAEKELENANAELEKRRTICKYTGVPEDKAADRDVLLEKVSHRGEELRQIVLTLEKQADEVHLQYQRLTQGHIMELDKELREYLADVPVQLTYGFEWLRKNGLSEDENRELTVRFPLLPYAVIMSAADLERLKSQIPAVFTKFPVPIVVREKLSAGGKNNKTAFEEKDANAENGISLDIITESENGLKEENDTGIKKVSEGEQDTWTKKASETETNKKRDNQTAVVKGINEGESFYVWFNKELLGEKGYSAELDRLASEEEKIKAQLKDRNSEMSTYSGWMSQLSASSLTPDTYAEISARPGICKGRLDTLKEKLLTLRDSRNDMHARQEKTSGDIKDLEEKLLFIKRSLESVAAFKKSYENYQADMEELSEKRRDCEKEEGRIRLFRKTIEDLNQRLQALATSRRTCEDQGAELSEKVTFYASFHSDTPAGGDVMELEARFRALSEKISGERLMLEEESRKAENKLHKAEKEFARKATRYGVEDGEWKEVSFSIDEEERIRGLYDQKNKEVTDKNFQYTEADKKAGIADSAVASAMEQMRRTTGNEEVLQSSEIRNIDFDAEAARLSGLVRISENALSKVNERISIYQENINALKDYSDLKAEDDVAFTQHFEDMDRKAIGDYRGELGRNYRNAGEKADKARGALVEYIRSLLDKEMYSTDEFFSKPLASMLDISGGADFYMEQLRSVVSAFEATKGRLDTDLAVVENERETIVTQLLDYIKDVNENLTLIDDNSTITVRDRQLRMLKITVPDWSVNEGTYRVRVGDCLSEITQNSIRHMDAGENPEEYIATQITTKNLYDRVVGTSQVQIHLYKIESSGEQLVTWTRAAKNSGGEGFVCAFVVLACLLSYMRRPIGDVLGERNEGKVLIMDNPFAQTNAPHLLRPLMDMAKRTNTQLICLTGLGGDAIYSCFDNIYVCNLIPTSLHAGESYLRKDHIRGSEEQDILSSHIEVLGQQELLF